MVSKVVERGAKKRQLLMSGSRCFGAGEEGTGGYSNCFAGKTERAWVTGCRIMGGCDSGSFIRGLMWSITRRAGMRFEGATSATVGVKDLWMGWTARCCIRDQWAGCGRSMYGIRSLRSREKWLRARGVSWRYNEAVKRQIHVVFENGVLRPLEPVDFSERQELVVTVSEEEAVMKVDPAPVPYSTRSLEYQWLKEHP